MPKDPTKGKPHSGRDPSDTQDVTTSQVMSVRDLGEPPVPPAQVRSERRSTTHGVGWYAAEEADDLAQPVRPRSRKTLLIVAVIAVSLGALAGLYIRWRTHEASPPRPPAPAVPSEGVAPTFDAAPARTARLTVKSQPPGADIAIDGKPAGKAPLQLDVPEKSRVVVEVTLAEHQPWRDEIEVGPKGRKVTAKLTRISVDAGLPPTTVPAEPTPPSKKVSAAKVRKKKKATRPKKAAPAKKTTPPAKKTTR